MEPEIDALFDFVLRLGDHVHRWTEDNIKSTIPARVEEDIIYSSLVVTFNATIDNGLERQRQKRTEYHTLKSRETHTSQTHPMYPYYVVCW